MQEKEHCFTCGADGLVEELYEFDGRHYCYRCLNECTTTCEHCGTRIYDDDNVGDTITPLCSRCYEAAYTTCCRCGRIIHNDSAHYLDDDDYEAYCGNCFSQRCKRVIHDYYYKPEPIFYGEGSRYFGIELEVDDGGELDSKAETVLDIANANGLEHIYAKHDGSLSDGWEAVSHPATLEYHLKEIPWSAVLDKLRELGYTSHQARTCGLHIHVNRTAFGSTTEMQDECIARILYLFAKFWPEILKFSRRTQRQLERWASRYGFRNRPKEILDHAKYETGNSRYTCVNLTNEDTIEIRVFRGTLKYNTFVASLQFVDRLCDLALFMSDEELENMSWSTFALGCTEPELVRYLKERQLYINEPVESEAEI